MNRPQTLLLSLASMMGFLGTPVIAGVGGGPFVSGMMRGLASNEVVTDAVLLPTGNIAMCGWVEQVQVWDDAPGWQHVAQGGHEAFIAIMTPDLLQVKAFTLLGGAADDHATAITVDQQGRIFVVGWTESANFPTTASTINPMYSSYVDGFLACFSADLTHLDFATYITGNGNDIPYDIVLDANGSIFICGETTSRTSFRTNNGLFKTYIGNGDGFVMRLSPSAAAVQFSTYFGGSSHDKFTAITLDNSGTIVLTGSTSSADLPMFPAFNPLLWWQYYERPYDWTYNGGDSDAMLVVLSQDGARCISSTYFGGIGNDEGNGVVVIDGTIYLLGTTSSADLPVIAARQGSLRGASDAFLSSFKNNGGTLTNSSYIGGSGDERARSMSVYRQSTLCITGTTSSNDFPATGYRTASDVRGGMDAFVILGNTSNISFGTTVGGSMDDEVATSVVLEDGGVVLLGTSSSATIQLSNETLIANGRAPSTDAFGVQIQHGAIDLGQPVGGERFCQGAMIRFSWLPIEMEASDRYQLEYSLDHETWKSLASAIDGSKFEWTGSTLLEPNKAYFFRVVSTRGHVSSTDKPVILDAAPAVTGQPPSEALICPNGSVTLHAQVVGQGMSYQWLRGTSELLGATSDSLTLSDGSPPGVYALRYRAACGSVGVTSSCTVSLGMQTVVTSQPHGDTVVAGQPVMLSVTAQGGKLAYQWYKDGVLLTGATMPGLVLASSQIEESGQYYCLIQGECGTVESTVATLLVEPPTGVSDGVHTTLSVYPNPSTGEFTIQYPELSQPTTLVAIDVVGKAAGTWLIPAATTHAHLRAHELAPGIYYVRALGNAELRWTIQITQ